MKQEKNFNNRWRRKLRHATEKPMPNGLTFLEVRMFDNYDKVHTTNWTSFLIYYEVCKEIDQ